MQQIENEESTAEQLDTQEATQPTTPLSLEERAQRVKGELPQIFKGARVETVRNAANEIVLSAQYPNDTEARAVIYITHDGLRLEKTKGAMTAAIKERLTDILNRK